MSRFTPLRGDWGEPVRAHVGTEFGVSMQRLVAATPGARGAVLSDGRGEAIDFAHRTATISRLDVQLAGAQIGQGIAQVQRTAETLGLGTAAVLIEAARGTLLAGLLGEGYVLTVILEPRANLARAFEEFHHARGELAQLL